ncbi:hypothetical protein [Cereibacter azotoformans]|uniref:hypothetical protein n=1 Tax=Cereibacter azotoformans TaxID=43057 RepID=UPI000C6CF47D|nr:hypothetical protein [Cereibacter azotoformans]
MYMPFDHIMHERLSLLFEAVEDMLIEQGVCNPSETNEYLTALYIREVSTFMSGASYYLDAEERVAGWIFIHTLTAHSRTKRFRKYCRELGHHISTHTTVYLPRYHEMLTKAYLEVLHTVKDLRTVALHGTILLAAATLPGLRTDLRREFKRRGLEYDKLIVPDDVLARRMKAGLHPSKLIKGTRPSPLIG